MAAAEAPVSVRSLSPVGQTLRQVRGATMLILLLFSHWKRNSAQSSAVREVTGRACEPGAGLTGVFFG